MTTNTSLLDSIAFLVAAFAIFGFSDAILLHIWKFQLYKWKDTAKEHKIHAIRSVLFPFLILGILIFQFKGILLVGFLSIVFIDLLVQIWDMWIEREARTRFQGLSSLEYTIHGILIGIHSSFLALYLVYNFQMDHFHESSQSFHFLNHSFSSMIAWNLLPGAVLIGILHCILIHPYFQKDHKWENYFKFSISFPGLN
jgi:hypothetical protein